MLHRRGFLGLSALGLAGSLFESPAYAAAYPARPVKMIATDPPGAAIDVVARIFADQLGSALGQQFVVENRAGGTGLLAAQATINAEADGYTLLAAAGSTFIVLPAQREKLPIDVNRDLAPIALFGELPQVVAVSSKLDIPNLGALLALANKEPERFFCGTNGSGTFPHLTAKRLVEVTKAPITIVPYAAGGTSEVMRDVLGERLQLVISSLSALKGLIKSGDLRVLAIATRARLPNFPDWPTIAETVPGFTAVGWSALMAPAGTPPDAVAALSKAMATITENEGVRNRLADLGTYPRTLSPSDLQAFILEEQKNWWPIVKANAAQGKQ